jgi:hypothetical protein
VENKPTVDDRQSLSSGYNRSTELTLRQNELRGLIHLPDDNITFPSLQGLELEPQDAFHASPLYKRLFDHLEVRQTPTRTTTIHAIVHTHLRLPTPEQPEIQQPEHAHLAFRFPVAETTEAEPTKSQHPLPEKKVWARLFSSSRLFKQL